MRWPRCDHTQQPWLRSDACVFAAWDLETSGPDPLQHEIVQIAAVSVAGNFKSLVRPRRGDVTARARELHGLGDEQLRAAPTFPEVVKEFVRFLAEEVRQFESGDDLFLAAEVTADWGLGPWTSLPSTLEMLSERRVVLQSGDTLDAARHLGAPCRGSSGLF